MSVCNGIAGKRGNSPIGAFIHNDAGGKYLNAEYWYNALLNGSHNIENGFAHYYVGSDGVRQVEDDSNCAWHCGDTYCNSQYLSFEVCQSYGDLETFKQSEEETLKLVAEKFKQYNIVPNENTVRLHREVYATACPHRSVEIHGGEEQTKQYFINRIKQLMGTETKQETNKQTIMGEDEMKCFYTVNGKAPVYYFDGTDIRPMSHPDEVNILNKIYKDCTGKDIPCYSWNDAAPWHARLQGAIKRKPV